MHQRHAAGLGPAQTQGLRGAGLGALRLGLLLCAATAAWTPGAASAAAAGSAADRQTCESQGARQAMDSCLKETAAARAEAQQHTLDNGVSPAQRQRNALARCTDLPADQRVACERLAQGEGQRSGSVAGGGVLKRLVSRDDDAMPASGNPASAASAASAAVAGSRASSPAPR